MMSNALAPHQGGSPQLSCRRGSHAPLRGVISAYSRQQQRQQPRAALPARNGAVSALHLQTSRESCRLQRVPRKPQWLPTSRRHAALQCTAVAGSAAEPAPPSSDTGRTLLLGALFGGWYLFNIYFNIYNKNVLKVFPYPITCTVLQFGVGSLLAITMWTLDLHPKPDISGATIKRVSPLAAVHTLGNLLTNVSLGRVAVSFTHTIKAMEPFFSVLLSWLFLNQPSSPLVLLSLLPIVGGVAMASVSEVTFNWPGFLAAMGSNVTFQSRNVLSKKFMGNAGKGTLDNINLFSCITIISFFLLLPVALLVEGVRFTPAAIRAAGLAPNVVMKQAIIAAVCFHAYQQVSYMILQRVSPVTHSIGNCLKRVIVIVASVLVFHNPMSRQNMIGTGVALAGVFAYSQVKRVQTSKPKAA